MLCQGFAGKCCIYRSRSHACAPCRLCNRKQYPRFGYADLQGRSAASEKSLSFSIGRREEKRFYIGAGDTDCAGNVSPFQPPVPQSAVNCLTMDAKQFRYLLNCKQFGLCGFFQMQYLPDIEE